MDDNWSTPILAEYGINLANLPNNKAVKKMITALSTLASTTDGLISAKNALLKQPNVRTFIDSKNGQSHELNAMNGGKNDISIRAGGGEMSGVKKEVVKDMNYHRQEKIRIIREAEALQSERQDEPQVKRVKDIVPVTLQSTTALHSNNDLSDVPSITKPDTPIESAALIPRPSIQSLQSNDQMDLNSDDDDLDDRIKVDQTDIVCFGLLTTSFSTVQLSILHNALGQQTNLDVLIMAEPTGNPSIYALRVDTVGGLKVGYVERKMCVSMSPLLKNLRIEGTVPRPATITSPPVLLLTLFGSKLIVTHLGSYLSKQNIILGPCLKPVGFPTINPHAYLNASQRSELMQVGAQTRTVDEVKSDIDSLYDTLTAAEDLPEMEPDTKLSTPLFPHQKQALHFLYGCENPADNNGGGMWRKHDNGTFENLISGENAVGTPKFHKGGILADDMGLGKTIEVISLILKTQGQSGEFSSFVRGQMMDGEGDIDPCLVPTKGTLIVCPLSTVSNWEEQIIQHCKRGSLSVYVYHGAARCQDPRIMSKFNVVLTTYNVLSIEFSKDVKNFKRNSPDARPNARIPIAQMNSILHKMLWFRVVLDEAHLIKDPATGQAKSACALSADRRWSLTGTPIQNKLEDLFSLVNFLKVEPFGTKASWNDYITKAMRLKAPSGGSVGVSRLQTLIKSITLRRIKTSKIKGKPILSLPPRLDRVESLTLCASEQILYDRASAQAKSMFENYESKGTALRHYVHLLELILKLRQICTHPLLVKNYTELRDQEDFDGSGVKWDQKRAADVLTLLKDSGDGNCGGCNVSVDEAEIVPFVTICGHLMCETCYKKTIQESPIHCPMCQNTLQKSDILSVVEDTLDDSSEISSMPAALLSSGKNKKGVLNPDAITSTKVIALLADLAEVKATNDASGEVPVKSVIFSQWTTMLDLIERPLLQAGHRFVRLDGRMSRPDRTTSLDKFKKDNSITVMLISLKAGGVGLNLTSASRVYMMEPYWNPAVEQQAVDRVHRLGQTRPVHTIRFITTPTIEDSIIEMQKRKMELTNITFKEGVGGGDLSALENKKRKRVDGKKDKVKLQEQKMDDLRRMFNMGSK